MGEWGKREVFQERGVSEKVENFKRKWSMAPNAPDPQERR